MTLTGRGAITSFNFPFSGTFNWNAGSTPTAVTTGSNITRVTVSDTAAPTNATAGTGSAFGTRGFRVQYADLASGVTPVTGLNPIVTMRFNSQDALTVTQDQLYVSEATSLSGPWTIRSSVYGATGALPAAGLKATDTAAPGPIVPTNNSYYAWASLSPTISDVTPTTVCANSGTFTITGTNFTGVTAVTIGGTAVTAFTVVSATSITGFAGNGTTGVVAVTKSGSITSGLQTITVSPSPVAPAVSPISASITLGANASFTATGAGGTLNWYAAATGGTALFTGATYTPAGICSTTTYYVSENNGSCDGARTAVQVTVQATTITATVAQFCGTGGNTVLTVAPYDSTATYTWESLAGGATLSATTGQSITASVTTVSDIKVTATKGACTATAVYSVSVYALPIATVTTSASGVCPGTSATIGSGLSAGNFSSIAIPSVFKTAPTNATTLVSANVFSVPLTSGNGDDGGWGALPVGFNFNFFGTNYNTINVGTNGTLTFGTYNSTALADYAFTTLPSTTEPFNMVAVLAMDNDLRSLDGGAIKYWTEGYAPNRRFIVSYEDVKELGDVTYSTSQATFYETTGVIEVNVIYSTNTDRNKLVGVNNGNGTIGVLAYTSGTTASATNPIASPFAYRFTPPANYTTTWTATNANGTTTIASGTNIFSQTVAPLITTTYNISYTNQTTGCTNAAGSAQVVMSILGTVAPTGVTTLATANAVCLGDSVTLSMDYTGSNDGLLFQWQSSVDNGTSWQNIATAAAATYVFTPTLDAQYRCKIVSCGGTPSYSSATTVAFTNSILSTVSATRCGAGSVTLTATGTPGATIRWYTTATGGAPEFGASPYVTPVLGASTVYYVAAETINPALCSSTRVAVPVTINPAPAFTLSGNPAAVCSGNSTAAVTITAGAATYNTFVWTPATGVSGNATTGWTFNPTVSTTYVVVASQSGGALCETSASVSISINSNPSAIVVTPATNSICLGAIQTLTATGGLIGTTATATVGVDNGLSSISTTGVPYRTGSVLNNEIRSQYLVTAGELTAAGIVAGNLTSLNFLVTSGGGGTMSNLTFNIGATSSTALTSTYETPSFTNVLTLPTYSPVVGANSHTFTTPFAWDGTSNIIVQVCGQLTTGGSGCVMTSTATSVISTIGNSTTTGCADATGLTLTNVRPIMVFGYTSQVPTTLTWLPVTNLYTDAAATVAYTTGTNASTVYFKSSIVGNSAITVTSTGANTCTNVGTTSVTVNAFPTVVTVNPAAICAGNTVDLQAAAVTFGSSAGLTFTYFTDANATATLANANAVATAGTYYIKGTNANGCSIIAPVTVTVNPLPTVVTVNPAAVCSGNTVNLQDPAVTFGSSSGLTFTYFTNTNATTTLANPNAVGTAGTYYIKGTDANGCSAVTSVTVTINPLPATPTVTATAATCSAAGISTVDNYNGALTYTSNPLGLTVGAGGAITGAVLGTPYTLTVTNGTCTSVASAPFTNAAQLITPAAPTVTTTAATCSAAGISTVSNYNAALTYVSTPTGLTVGAGGAITGATAGTAYTLTAANTTCTSVASASFTNAVQLTTPATPTVTTTAATCSSAGISTVSNYNAAWTYVSNPTGLTVGAGGAITGATAGTAYTLTAANTTCTSVASASFTNAAALNCDIQYANLQFPGTAAINNCGTATFYAQVYKLGVTEAAGAGAGITAWIATNTTNTDPATWPSSAWQLATFNTQSGNNDEYSYAVTGLTAGTYYVASRFQYTGGAFYYGGFTSTGGGAWGGSNVSAVLTVTNVAAPTGAATQDACNTRTLADFVVSGTSIVWYASAVSTTALPLSTTAVLNTIYYASQTIAGCTSPTRLAVTANGPCLGVKTFDEAGFSYYPNPVTEMLNFNYSAAISNVQIVNILGQVLVTKTINATEGQIDMSNLPSGTYLVKVKSDELEKTIKVIKK